MDQSKSTAEYRTFLEMTKDDDPLDPLRVVTDLAMQLRANREGAESYDPQSDPIVKCFENLGLAVLAADDDVDTEELAYLSKFTAMLHSNAATLDGRIKKLLSGSEDAEPSNVKDTPTRRQSSTVFQVR